MSDRISEHVSLKEGIKSHTATRLNIDNIPRELDLINMKTIAEQVFEPLRKWVGGPIAINSFYRSPKLNSAIGGSTTSQHCIGCALDIDDNYGYKTNAEMYDYIKNNLDYDQIIWEFGTHYANVSDPAAAIRGSSESGYLADTEGDHEFVSVDRSFSIRSLHCH